MHLSLGAIAVAIAVTSPSFVVPASAQTQGMLRRQDRRQDRHDARGTRQEGRHDARNAKRECLEGDALRAECRQTKRGVKQGARQDARDIKTND
jgi:hypothetical protein